MDGRELDSLSLFLCSKGVRKGGVKGEIYISILSRSPAEGE